MQKYEPILTIAIPVYNKGRLFEFSLMSVIEAAVNLEEISGEIIEVLIVDDYSSENIKKHYDNVINSYAFKHARFYRNDYNFGRKNNYKKIIELSRGMFVWTIGSDDFIYKSSLHNIIKKIIEFPKVDSFIVNIRHYKIDMNRLGEYRLGSNHFSDYIDGLGITDNNSPEINFYSDKLADFINPSYNNVFLGAIMTTIVRKHLMMESMKELDEPLQHDKFYSVYSWYRNTYHLSMSFLDKPAYYLSNPMVIAGDGTRDWSKGINGGIWSSDYPYILFKVVPMIVELHISNGLKGRNAYLSRNNVAKIVGLLFFPNLIYGIVYKEFKYSFKELSLFKSIFKYIYFPGLYLGIIRSLFAVIKKIVVN